MFELFKWGFVAAMTLTWLALGVGVVMLLLPGRPRATRAIGSIEQKRAA